MYTIVLAIDYPVYRNIRMMDLPVNVAVDVSDFLFPLFFINFLELLFEFAIHL